jgi:hypothetical protein
MSSVKEVLNKKANLENRKTDWKETNRRTIDILSEGVNNSIENENKRLREEGREEMDIYEMNRMRREAERNMGF